MSVLEEMTPVRRSAKQGNYLCNSDCCIFSYNNTSKSEKMYSLLTITGKPCVLEFYCVLFMICIFTSHAKLYKSKFIKKSMEFLRRIFRHAFEKSLNVFRISYGLNIQFLSAHGKRFLKKQLIKSLHQGTRKFINLQT